MKRKKKEHASIITKTLNAQVSKRQEFAEAERKRKLDHEAQQVRDNEQYLEARKSLQKEWRDKARMASEQDRERRRLLGSMQVPY